MKLLEHQRAIIEQDPKQVPLALGTGTGKTRISLELAYARTLVVCPKDQKLDETWPLNAAKFNIIVNLKVASKEEFRRDAKNLPKCNTLILDEVHHHLGVYPDTVVRKGVQIPRTSQLFAETLAYIKRCQPERIYLVSATPISKPMNLYAAALLLGKNWDFYSFRSRFYIERRKGFRTIWIPRTDEATKELLIKIFKEELGAFTGRLQDFTDVPEQVYVEKHFGMTTAQKAAMKELDQEADPMWRRTKTRQIENGILYYDEVVDTGDKTERVIRSTKHFHTEKMDYILERAEEFEKMLIFANWTAQVDAIYDKLKEAGYHVVKLTGKTKKSERATLIRDAEASKKTIVVAQSSLSAGYELKTFPCCIFASMSHLVRDRIQGEGRLLRADAIKSNLYITLITRGGADEACYKTISNGVDFSEALLSNE